MESIKKMEGEHQGTQQPNAMTMIREMQSEMIYFKDEVLRDMRKLELQTKAHTDKRNSELDKRLTAMEALFSKLSTKFTEVACPMTESSSKVEKIDQLFAMMNKLEDRLNANDAKTSTGIKEQSELSYKYDKMVMSNLLIPGFIGDKCKFPNLKEYILWLNIQLSSYSTEKEKQSLDLKGYKEKLDRTFHSFNSSIDKVKASLHEGCKQSAATCERSFNERIKVTEELIACLRTENSSYALTMKNDLLSFKEEWKKIIAVKEDIIVKFNAEMEQFKAESSMNIAKCTKFQREYKQIKAKFNELSDFIKDVRFRSNLGEAMNRREFMLMSNRLSYKKNGMRSSRRSRSLLKSLDTDVFHFEKKDDSCFLQRRETLSATDLLTHKPDFFDQITRDEIKLFSLYRAKKKESGGGEDNALSRPFNNKTLSILKRNNKAKANVPEEEDLSKTNQLPKKRNSSLLKPNDFITSRRDSFAIDSHKAKPNASTHRDKADSKKPMYIQLRDKIKAEIKLNQQGLMLNNSSTKQLKGNDSVHLLQNNSALISANRTMEQNLKPMSETLLKLKNENELLLDELRLKHQEQQALSEVLAKISSAESKISHIENSTNKKLEAIHQQFLRFFTQFIDDDMRLGSKLRILKYPAGIFVPSNFDHKNLDNYFPDPRKNISQSTKSRANQRQIIRNDLLSGQSQALRAQSRKNKVNSSSMRQTFYSLSALMTNNPTRHCPEEQHLLHRKPEKTVDKESATEDMIKPC